MITAHPSWLEACSRMGLTPKFQCRSEPNYTADYYFGEWELAHRKWWAQTDKIVEDNLARTTRSLIDSCKAMMTAIEDSDK